MKSRIGFQDRFHLILILYAHMHGVDGAYMGQIEISTRIVFGPVIQSAEIVQMRNISGWKTSEAEAFDQGIEVLAARGERKHRSSQEQLQLCS